MQGHSARGEGPRATQPPPNRRPILGGSLGALAGAFVAGPLVWLLGHRGGESTAGMVAALAVGGSLLVAVVTGIGGALGGAIGGAGRVTAQGEIGLGAGAGALVSGVFDLLWLGRGGEIGSTVVTALVLAALGAVGGAIGGAVGSGVRKVLGRGS